MLPFETICYRIEVINKVMNLWNPNYMHATNVNFEIRISNAMLMCWNWVKWIAPWPNVEDIALLAF